MVVIFNSNPSTTIISFYSPTNVSDEMDFITFYNELSSFVCSIPKHNNLIISGNTNAQIGKNINNKFSLHNSSNRNGEHLTDFTLEKLWTYTYANNTKAQIDYILRNKKWNNSTLNYEAYSFFEEVPSNHRIVTAKIWLSL